MHFGHHRDRVYEPVNKRNTTPVSIADAVAELCQPTGDEDMDFLYATLIDLLQKGHLKPARDKWGTLRFAPSGPSGAARVREFLEP